VFQQTPENNNVLQQIFPNDNHEHDKSRAPPGRCHINEGYRTTPKKPRIGGGLGLTRLPELNSEEYLKVAGVGVSPEFAGVVWLVRECVQVYL
jgi:hypothetical protein